MSAPETHSNSWQPESSRRRLFSVIVSWLATGVALMVAAGILPGVGIDNFWGALVVAAVAAALNAVIPPVLAALRGSRRFSSYQWHEFTRSHTKWMTRE